MISPEMLRRYSCFSGVSEETLKAVAMIAEEVSVPTDTTLFRERDPANSLSIIVEGEVDIQCRLGRDEVHIVDTLIAGELLGFSALVEPYRMTNSARSRKPTRLMCIEAAELRRLCLQDSTLGYHLMRQIAANLSERLEAARVQLGTVAIPV